MSKSARFGARWNLLRLSVAAWGWPAVVRFAAATVRSRRVARVPVPGLAEPVLFRRHTEDLGVLTQVFVTREFDLDLPEPPAWIIDCGAHVGYAAIAFASAFPDAQVVAVEPESGNLELLRQNVRAYPNVEVVEGAVWAGPEDFVHIDDPGAATWAFQVGVSGEGAPVPALRVGDLVGRFDGRGTGLVKLDVEGTEREIFGAPCEWLDRVRYLVVELHDRMIPGCEAALASALEGRRFRRTQRGENVLIDLGAVDVTPA